MRQILLPVLFILIVIVIGVACGGPAAAPTATSVPPAKPTTPPAPAPSATSAPPAAKPTNTPAQALDGKALMNERCTVCHTTERIQAAKKSKADWQATVARMKANGAKLNDAETAALVDFLAATYK
jgi:cytochrome c5